MFDKRDRQHLRDELDEESKLRERQGVSPGKVTRTTRLRARVPISRKATDSSQLGSQLGSQLDEDATERVAAAASAAGQPLPDELRAHLESALGQDVGSARVHTDSSAARAAHSVRARAYTQGSDIYFGQGQYQPDSKEGQRLIAHEVAHTLQASGSPADAKAVSEPGDTHERAADEFADLFVSGHVAAPPALGSAPEGIHRWPWDDDKKEESAETDPEAAQAEALKKIQAQQMSSLLTSLESIDPPEAGTNYTLAAKIGGPRLVTAMEVIHKPAPWTEFIDSHAHLRSLGADQIGAVMKKLGAPKDAAYYKPADLGAPFDAAVDPAGKSVKIYSRVKIVDSGVAAGHGSGSEAELKKRQQLIDDFKAGFPAAVEKVWKGGSISPSIKELPTFACQIKVTVVESGEHIVFNLTRDQGVGSHSKTLQDSDYKDKQQTDTVLDPKATKGREDTRNYNTAAHEWGHQAGVDHVRDDLDMDNIKEQNKTDKPGAKKKFAERERAVKGGIEQPRYGVTPEERSSVMGAGDKKVVLHDAKGNVTHNDFKPHQTAVEAWSKEFVKADVTWSGG